MLYIVVVALTNQKKRTVTSEIARVDAIGPATAENTAYTYYHKLFPEYEIITKAYILEEIKAL